MLNFTFPKLPELDFSDDVSLFSVVINDHHLYETEGQEERIQIKKMVLVSGEA